MINGHHSLPHVPRGSGAAAVRVAGFGLATLLCQSVFWSQANPVALKAVVVGAALLAAFRPRAAMLALAAVVPLGRVIFPLIFPETSVGITEVLALAFLAGWGVSRLRGAAHHGQSPSGLVLGSMFAAVVVASLLVDIGILRYWKDYWQPFLGRLFTYFTRDYLNVGIEFRPWANSFGGLASAATAALFLEGLALSRAAEVLCEEHPSFGRRLLGTLTIAAVGTAVLSVGAAFQLSSTEGRSLLSVVQTSRIAVHVTKVNTAASYFVLFIPVLIGLGVWSAQSRPRRPSMRAVTWTAAAVGGGLLLAALWLTGTRSALLAGVVVAAGASVYALTRGRRRPLTWRSAVAIVIACSMVVAVLGLGFYMRTAALESASMARGSFPVRLLMWRAALTTLTARPLFGMGIGQFPFRVTEFDPNAALPANVGLSRFNAHNQFLETAAELGVIGGVLFVAMFAAILWRAWNAFRTSRDPALGGAIAGVMAFLITCLAGQPLLYNLVAFPFWMVLGVLLAAGDLAAEAACAQPTPAGRRLWRRVIAGFVIVLAVSIPVRVLQGKDGVNFALAAYGFSGWYEPSDGRHYRLVRGDGTFFTYPHARWLKLPIRRDAEAGRNLLEVDVSLDGRRARTLTLADDEWQTVEFMIPADANRRFRRIDLAVRAPAGVPAQIRVAPAEIREDETMDPAQMNLRPVPWDLTGDRKSDILWRHAARGEVWVWPMDGATRGAETNVATVAGTDWAIRGVADQNGDGTADILWRHAPTGMVYYWPMNGGTRLSETYVGTVDPAYDIVGTGDYNGDGKSDILWRHRTNGELWVWLMDGATPVSIRYVDTVDPGYVVKGSGDLDGDGKADIVWHHATRGDVWVWLMNGTTRVSQTWVGTVPDVGYQIVGVADHTGEGNADLLWHHATRGEVWLWPMNGATRLSETRVAIMPDTGNRVVGTGDYDGDGKADIVWHHATRGEVWLWQMNGATRLSETKVATVPDVGYQIVR